MPFTLVGVYFGHLLHDMPISVLSGFGVGLSWASSILELEEKISFNIKSV